MASKTRLRLQPDHRMAFLQSFLKSPKQVGSIIPSSRFLERRVTRATRAHRAKLVVELGPGTGVVTEALIARGIPASRLILIEYSPQFSKLLAERFHVTVVAWVSKVGPLVAECDPERVTREDVDVTPIRCPDLAVAARMIEAVEAVRKDGDSLGGIVSCAVRTRRLFSGLPSIILCSSLISCLLIFKEEFRRYFWRA